MTTALLCKPSLQLSLPYVSIELIFKNASYLPSNKCSTSALLLGSLGSLQPPSLQNPLSRAVSFPAVTTDLYLFLAPVSMPPFSETAQILLGALDVRSWDIMCHCTLFQQCKRWPWFYCNCLELASIS